MITAQLLLHKPDNPKRFIAKYVETVKLQGTAPLLNEEDLRTMFAMFDVTKRGVVSFEQAEAALRSVLGPQATLADTSSLTPGSFIKEKEFVDAMMQALKEAVPYK